VEHDSSNNRPRKRSSWVPTIVDTDVKGLNPELARYYEARNALIRQGVDPTEAARLTQEERNAAAMAFLPLAKKVAKSRLYTIPDVEFDDVLSFAMIGVLWAVEHFDPSRGVPFLVYVHRNARYFIKNQSRVQSHVPAYARGDAYRLERVLDKLRHALQAEPTETDLARELGISADDAVKTLRRHRQAGSRYTAESNMSTEDLRVVAWPTWVDPEPELGVDDNDCRHAGKILEKMNERDLEILWMRVVEEKTLDEIGAQFRLCRERVRQIVARNVKKGWRRGA
jgi:RNA polymerase sigma factor for flagellar operon FliA